MNNTKAITLYHQVYNASLRLNEWAKACYEQATIKADMKVNVIDSGLKSANVIKLRILTTDKISIKIGDKVVIGISKLLTPPNDAYTVVGFVDNRKGSLLLQHWAVLCQ